MSLCAIIAGSRTKGSKIFCTEATVTWTWKESLVESLAFITRGEFKHLSRYRGPRITTIRRRSYFFTVLGERQAGRRGKFPHRVRLVLLARLKKAKKYCLSCRLLDIVLSSFWTTGSKIGPHWASRCSGLTFLITLMLVKSSSSTTYPISLRSMRKQRENLGPHLCTRIWSWRALIGLL